MPRKTANVALYLGNTETKCPRCGDHEMEVEVTNELGARRGFCKLCIAQIVDFIYDGSAR